MKKNVIFFAGIAALVATSLIYFLYIREETGECQKIKDLPIYGSELAAVETGSIHYTINRGSKILYAKTTISIGEFNALCETLNLDVSKYQTRENIPYLFDSIPNDFLPSASSIKLGFGILSGRGRSKTIRLYLELNDVNKGDREMLLYIHIT